jgi:hypothetical protein
LARPRGHDVDHPHRQLGHRRVRLPSQRSETATDGALDAHWIERNNATVALDDRLRQGDLLDAVKGVFVAIRERQIELRDAVRGMDGLGIRSVHACTYHHQF